MAALKEIDHDRNVSITPARETTLDYPEIVELAKQKNDPNLLICDVPMAEQCVRLSGDGSRRFLEWLAVTSWSVVVERHLQQQTAKGEPLLSSWLALDLFEKMASEAHAANALPSMKESITRWRACNTCNVYIDAFELIV